MNFPKTCELMTFLRCMLLEFDVKVTFLEKWTISFHIFQIKVLLNVFLFPFLKASKNSRLPFHAPVLCALDLRPFQTAQLNYQLMINLATATSYGIKTARNKIILLGQMILLFWNLKIEPLLSTGWSRRSYITAYIWRCFRYVFPLCLIKVVRGNVDFSWGKKHSKLFDAISVWHMEYIGHKNMSFFSFCLGIFKQLVFSNVSLSLTCFPPKAKYLFISVSWRKGIHKSCRPSLWPLLDLNPTPSSGKYITQGFYIRGPQRRH